MTGAAGFIGYTLSNALLARGDHVCRCPCLAVAHDALLNRPMDQFLSKIAKGGCFVDVKSRMAKAALDERGVLVWRL